MLRRLIEVRMLIALAIAAGVGIGGPRAFPKRRASRLTSPEPTASRQRSLAESY
jgi:hypothetical protein